MFVYVACLGGSLVQSILRLTQKTSIAPRAVISGGIRNPMKCKCKLQEYLFGQYCFLGAIADMFGGS